MEFSRRQVRAATGYNRGLIRHPCGVLDYQSNTTPARTCPLRGINTLSPHHLSLSDLALISIIYKHIDIAG